MKNIMIRNVPDEVQAGLRLRAKRNGRTTAAEIREVLAVAALPEGRELLGAALEGIGRAYGGLDLGVLKKEEKKSDPA